MLCHVPEKIVVARVNRCRFVGRYRLLLFAAVESKVALVTECVVALIALSILEVGYRSKESTTTWRGRQLFFMKGVVNDEQIWREDGMSWVSFLAVVSPTGQIKHAI